jgi:small subunit ribosomal protein S8
MAVNDPVADFLTRVRNALSAQHDTVVIPSSKLKVELARILREQGYIEDYGTEPARVGEALRIRLKYTDERASVISGLKRVSTPGRRTYVHSGEIPKILGGMGTTIISTSSGVMTGHDAKRQGVGGEVVAYVW